MEAIIDNIAYYDLTEVQHKNPNFGKEAPNANKVIEKEKIPADAFIFVSFSKKKGKFTKLAPDSTYKSRKCMILKSWIDAHVHPFAIGKLSRDDNHKESKKYPPLPDMITLSEEEQFKDALQNISNTFFNVCSNVLSYQERKLQRVCQFTEKEHEMRLIESKKGNMIIKSLLDKINNIQ